MLAPPAFMNKAPFVQSQAMISWEQSIVVVHMVGGIATTTFPSAFRNPGFSPAAIHAESSK